MKGLMFTEFLDMVEARWSLEMVDRIIERAGVAGAYTAVGNYRHGELNALVTALAVETQQPVPDLTRAYGRHLFGRLVQSYPRVVQGMTDSLACLAGIEEVVHAEVRKLYPNADLPEFHVERRPGGVILTYYSAHPFVDLAQGLIEGCILYFGDTLGVHREPPPAGTAAQARFVITAGDAP